MYAPQPGYGPPQEVIVEQEPECCCFPFCCFPCNCFDCY